MTSHTASRFLVGNRHDAETVLLLQPPRSAPLWCDAIDTARRFTTAAEASRTADQCRRFGAANGLAGTVVLFEEIDTATPTASLAELTDDEERARVQAEQERTT